MNARINELMAKGRKLVLEPQVAALEEMYAGLFAGAPNHSPEPDAGGSDNAPNEPENETLVQGQMDAYLMDIKDGIIQQYDVSPDEALDKVFEVADELDAAGQLPPMPDDDSSDEEVTEWLAAARSMGFAAAVMTSAEEKANETPEEEAGEDEDEMEDLDKEGMEEQKAQVSELMNYLQTEGYDLEPTMPVKELFASIAQTSDLAWLQADVDFLALTEACKKKKN